MAVFSTNEFLKQLCRLKSDDQGHVQDGIEVILADPNLDRYSRPYLNKFKLKQYHPAGNKQLTIFFEILANGDVFLRWLNDYKFLHDTFMSFGDDPCFKGLEKFLSSVENLQFNQAIHGFTPKVDPKYGNTIFISLKKLGISITTQPNSQDNGLSFTSNSVGIFDHDGDDRETIECYLDFKEFLSSVKEYFKNTSPAKFAFEIPDGVIDQYILDGLINATGSDDSWIVEGFDEDDYFVIKLK